MSDKPYKLTEKEMAGLKRAAERAEAKRQDVAVHTGVVQPKAAIEVVHQRAKDAQDRDKQR